MVLPMQNFQKIAQLSPDPTYTKFDLLGRNTPAILAWSSTTTAFAVERMILTGKAFRFFSPHVVDLQGIQRHHPLLADLLPIQRAVTNLHEQGAGA